MIRVLVVEDSPVIRELLVHLLNTDGGIQVVGTASNGEEAVEAVVRTHPDIITMDIHMPKMNGLDATRRIMETHPTPIVVVSGSSKPQVASLPFVAIEAGALAVTERPRGIGHPEHQAMASRLIKTVKLMAEVPVVRRWARRTGQPVLGSEFAGVPDKLSVASTAKVVAIGTSTGGPPVLQKLLSTLPADFPLPILIVQHITPGFSAGLIEWLQTNSKLGIHSAEHGALALAGNVYLAPDNFHLGIDSDGRLRLSDGPPENGHRPSVAHLFRSVSTAFGAHAVGVLLTGMGKDGSQELKLMKDAGAITIAQDKSSSIVHGMPGEAIQLGGASFVVNANHLAAVIIELANRTEGVNQ